MPGSNPSSAASSVTVTDVASSTSTDRSAVVGTTAVQLMAANANRKGAEVTNDSQNTVYLQFGATAVAGQGQRLNALGGSWDGLLSGALWQGTVSAIASAASSNVTAVEAT